MGFALLTKGLCFAVFIFAMYTLVNQLVNLTQIKPLTSNSMRKGPMVSLLVTASNEKPTIGPCIGSLLNQDYENFEVNVCDDQSDDNTAHILEQLSDPRLRVIQVRSLPEGWTGKDWACYNVALAARGVTLHRRGQLEWKGRIPAVVTREVRL